MQLVVLLLTALLALATGHDQAAGPEAAKTVVIDPGHNGGNASAPSEIARLVPAGGFMKACNTTGATTNDGRLTEPELNFTLARLVRQRLKQDGIRVVMTRRNNSGVGPCVDKRAAIGNRVGADVVLSIHADGNQSTETGFHIIRPGVKRGYNDGIQKASDRLAADLRDQLDKNEIGRSTYVGRGTGLDRRTDLAGLNLSHVPVALVEVGNMRSPRDAALMESRRWREETAEQFAAAIKIFLADASH